ncbi:MAG: hypothetical protein R3Y05_03615 [bacterium]
MKYTFKIKNIECPNCCGKIEDKVNKNKDIEIQINTMLEKIIINTDLDINEVKLLVDNVLKKFKPMSILWEN